MTNDELRLAIAKAKGMELETGIMGGLRTKLYWRTPDGFYTIRVPDWLHDYNDAMMLVAEMRASFFKLSIRLHDCDTDCEIIGDYRQGHNENIPEFYHHADGVLRAICEAWLKWKGSEK